jgi:hypothetical protein
MLAHSRVNRRRLASRIFALRFPPPITLGSVEITGQGRSCVPEWSCTSLTTRTASPATSPDRLRHYDASVTVAGTSRKKGRPVHIAARRRHRYTFRELRASAEGPCRRPTPVCSLHALWITVRFRDGRCGSRAAVLRLRKSVSCTLASRPSATLNQSSLRCHEPTFGLAPRLLDCQIHGGCPPGAPAIPEIRHSQDSTRPLIPQRRFRTLERFSGDSSGRNPDMS